MHSVAPHLEAEARRSPWLRSYIASRRALPHDDYGTQARLADAMCYTDDAAMAAVSPRRAVLLLSLFHEMIGAPHGTVNWAASERISAFQLATGVARLSQAGAIPRPLGLGLEASRVDKWHGGLATLWLGCHSSAAYGLVWVPHPKRLETCARLRRLRTGTIPVAEYRRLYGVLTSLLPMLAREPYILHGMSAPLKGDAELGISGSTLVECTPEIDRRAARLLEVLQNTPGASIFESEEPVRAPSSTLLWRITVDAAGAEAESPGIGVFLYGYHWRLPLSSDPRLPSLHITATEMLALGIGVILSDEIQEARRIELGSDASSAVFTALAAGDAPALVAVHEVLRARPEYARALPRVTVRHRYGESNTAADAVSRAYWGTLRRLCDATGLPCIRLPLPPAAMEFVADALDTVDAALDDSRRRSRAVAASRATFYSGDHVSMDGE